MGADPPVTVLNHRWQRSHLCNLLRALPCSANTRQPRGEVEFREDGRITGQRTISPEPRRTARPKNCGQDSGHDVPCAVRLKGLFSSGAELVPAGLLNKTQVSRLKKAPDPCSAQKAT